MSLMVTCPNTACAKTITVPPEASGEKINCPSCGTPLWIAILAAGEVKTEPVNDPATAQDAEFEVVDEAEAPGDASSAPLAQLLPAQDDRAAARPAARPRRLRRKPKEITPESLDPLTVEIFGHKVTPVHWLVLGGILIAMFAICALCGLVGLVAP